MQYKTIFAGKRQTTQTYSEDSPVTTTTVAGAVAGRVRVVLVAAQETHLAVVVPRVLQTVYQVAARDVADVPIPAPVGVQEAVRGVALTRVQGTVLQAVQVLVPVGVLGGNCD